MMDFHREIYSSYSTYPTYQNYLSYQNYPSYPNYPNYSKGEWSVAERTTFMEYLYNERS